MGSKEQDELCNTETEETNALQKRRSRRVSFAEITSVHVFDRDEDYETPPDSKLDSDAPVPSIEALPLFRGSSDNEDSKEEADIGADNSEDDAINGGKAFFRPIASPSPASAARSPNSNDEDINFGPVSASFIRARRLSDSATSDENCDITMDSTAFSMHFRSFARPENDDVNSIPSDFNEKTQNNGTSTGFGSSMVLTGARKPMPESSLPADNTSDGDDSNVMSLVRENPRKYDFGKISSGLDSLLAEGRKDLGPIIVSSHADAPKSLAVMSENLFNGSRDEKVDNRIEQEMKPANTVSSTYAIRSPSAVPKFTPMKLDTVSPCDSKANAYDVSTVMDQYVCTPKLPIKAIDLDGSEQSINDVLERSRLRLISAINSHAVYNVDDNISPLKLSEQHAFQHLASFGGLVKGNSLKKDRFGFDRNLDQDESTVPSARLDSLSSAKRLKVDSEIAIFSSPTHGISSTERLIFSAEKENSTNQNFLDSSVSNFKLFELSPLISDSKGENPIRQLKSSSFMSREFLNNNDCKENSHHQRRHLNLPNEHLFRSVGVNKGHQNVVASGCNLENKEKNGQLSQAEDRINHHDGDKSMCVGSVCRSFADVSNDSFPSAVSLPNPSRKEGAGDPLRTESLSRENVVTPKDNVSVPQTLGSARDLRAFDARNSFVSSPIRQKASISPNSKSSFRDNLVTNSNYTKGSEAFGVRDIFISSPARKDLSVSPNSKSRFLVTSVDSHKHKDTPNNQDIDDQHIRKGIFSSDGTPMVDALSDKQSHLGFVESYNPNDCIRPDVVHDTRLSSSTSFDFLDRSSVPESVEKAPVNSKVGGLESERPVENVQNPAYLCGTEKCYEEKSRMKLSISSPQIYERTTEYITQNVAKSPLLQRSTRQGRVNDVVRRLETNFELQDVNNLGCKRSSKETISPKDLSGPSFNQSRIASENIDGICASKHWSEVLMEIPRRSQFLDLSLLNDQGIDAMERILGHMQKVRKFESLNSQVQSQKNVSLRIEAKSKRATQARLVLCNMIYERARSQILRFKRDRLLGKVELLTAKKREFQMLKACVTNTQEARAGNFQMDNGDSQSRSGVFIGGQEPSVDTVDELKQKLDVVNREIENFMRLHQSSLRRTEAIQNDADEVVATVNAHLNERLCRSYIYNDIQLWDVDELRNTNRDHIIVLSYHNFVLQSLKIESGLVPSMIVSHKLNEVNIMKKFPNMDACVAFSFVINAVGTKKNVRHGSLAQETQITSLLLSTLLDVIVEIQSAQVELRNLARGNFHSPSADRLNLEIRFINFQTRQTVSSTFDVTCLKQAIYPCDIVPSRIDLISEAEDLQHHLPLRAEIEAAIGSLKPGYSRILRLCRCISRTLETSR